MALTKLTKDMDIIQKLGDEPNDVDGLSSSELKAKFDEGNNAIKDWINESFIPEVEQFLDESIVFEHSAEEIDAAVSRVEQGYTAEDVGAAKDDLSNVSNDVMKAKVEASGFVSGGGTAGVESFNGRQGAVVPQVGDYTAEMVGATSMTLLWENASPTSEFAAQTIPINPSEYDALYVVCRAPMIWGGADAVAGAGLAPKGKMTIISGTHLGMLWSRRFDVGVVDGVVSATVGRYWRYGENNNGVTDWADVMVPLKIYGVKGVS